MPPWWRGAVIDPIYPRSFRGSSGDGVGDLPGVLEKLEHVASLGVGAIGLFNLVPAPITVELSAPGSPEGPAQHVELQESTVSLGPNGFVFVRPASFITAVQVLTGR